MTAKNDFRAIIANYDETTHHATDLWHECDLSPKFRRLKKQIKKNCPGENHGWLKFWFDYTVCRRLCRSLRDGWQTFLYLIVNVCITFILQAFVCFCLLLYLFFIVLFLGRTKSRVLIQLCRRFFHSVIDDNLLMNVMILFYRLSCVLVFLFYFYCPFLGQDEIEDDWSFDSTIRMSYVGACSGHSVMDDKRFLLFDC